MLTSDERTASIRLRRSAGRLVCRCAILLLSRVQNMNWTVHVQGMYRACTAHVQGTFRACTVRACIVLTLRSFSYTNVQGMHPQPAPSLPPSLPACQPASLPISLPCQPTSRPTGMPLTPNRIASYNEDWLQHSPCPLPPSILWIGPAQEGGGGPTVDHSGEHMHRPWDLCQ